MCTVQGLSLRLAPRYAFHIISPHSGPFTSFHPTQGLSHHLAQLRADRILHFLAILRVLHIIAPHSGPSTSRHTPQELSHCLPFSLFFIYLFSCLLLFFWGGGGGSLLLITRLLASLLAVVRLRRRWSFRVPRQNNRHNLVTTPYVDVL